jgi:predicted ester cyclase
VDAEDVALRWIDLYNDVEPGTYGSGRFLDLYAPDCRWRESSSTFFPDGRSGDLAVLREALELNRSSLVDRNVLLHELVADGDRAAMRYAWSATTTVDLGPDLPPRGSRLRLEVAAFLRVADGKIVEIVELLSAPTGG